MFTNCRKYMDLFTLITWDKNAKKAWECGTGKTTHSLEQILFAVKSWTDSWTLSLPFHHLRIIQINLHEKFFLGMVTIEWPIRQEQRNINMNVKLFINLWRFCKKYKWTTYMPETSATLKICCVLEEGFPMVTLRALSMLNATSRM